MARAQEENYMATFYVSAVNLIGKGVVSEVGHISKELGYKSTFGDR